MKSSMKMNSIKEANGRKVSKSLMKGGIVFSMVFLFFSCKEDEYFSGTINGLSSLSGVYLDTVTVNISNTIDNNSTDKPIVYLNTYKCTFIDATNESVRFSVSDLTAGIYDLKISYRDDITILEKAFEVLEVKVDSMESNLIWTDYDENKKIYVDDTLVVTGENFRNYPEAIDLYYRYYEKKISLDYEIISVTNNQIQFKLQGPLYNLEGLEIHVICLNKRVTLGRFFYYIPVKLHSRYLLNEFYFNNIYYHYGEMGGTGLKANGTFTYPTFIIDDSIQVSRVNMDGPALYTGEDRYAFTLGFYNIPKLSLGEHTIRFLRTTFINGEPVKIPMWIEDGNRIVVEKPNLCFRQNEYSKQDTLSIELYSDNRNAQCSNYLFYRDRKIFLVDNHDSSLRFECSNVRYEFVTNPRNPEIKTTYFYFLAPKDIPANTFYKVEYEALGQAYDFETGNCDNAVILLK